MSDTPENIKANTQPKEKGFLSRAFGKVSSFISHNKSPTKVILGTGLLLGATALTTPYLNNIWGASAILGGSLYLLTKSSDILIDSATAIGEKFKIAPLMLGLGIGAMTSFPELLVAIKSVVSNTPEIGIGQLVGANIAHVFLIMGATAAIAAIPKSEALGWKFNTATMASVTVGFGALLAFNMLTMPVGIGLAAMTAGYLAANYYINKKDSATLGIEMNTAPHAHCHHGDDHDHDHPKSPWLSGLWGATGVAGLIYAASMAVDSASTVALGSGVSPAVVGSLGVAFGVSLPELTVNINAARQGKTDMAIGNILGCNIFNILFVGSALAIAGTSVPQAFGLGTTLGQFNLAALGVSAGLLTTTLFANGGGMKKWQGYGALALYAGYVATNLSLGGYDSTTPKVEPIAIEQQALPAPKTIELPKIK